MTGIEPLELDSNSIAWNDGTTKENDSIPNVVILDNLPSVENISDRG